MNTIGHQTVGPDLDSLFTGILVEHGQIDLAIFVFLKHIGLAVPHCMI